MFPEFTLELVAQPKPPIMRVSGLISGQQERNLKSDLI
jgi:hypothetical protein